MSRLQGAEAALEGKSLSARTLASALRAARGSTSDADAHPMAAQLAEGMLLSLLAPLVPKAGALFIILSILNDSIPGMASDWQGAAGTV